MCTHDWYEFWSRSRVTRWFRVLISVETYFHKIWELCLHYFLKLFELWIVICFPRRWDTDFLLRFWADNRSLSINLQQQKISHSTNGFLVQLHIYFNEAIYLPMASCRSLTQNIYQIGLWGACARRFSMPNIWPTVTNLKRLILGHRLSNCMFQRICDVVIAVIFDYYIRNIN